MSLSSAPGRLTGVVATVIGLVTLSELPAPSK
jgi:hypothetical protein